MSLSTITKFILPPVLASAAVFSVMTVPLAVIGDKQININFQEETLFFGKLRDVALPYVVASTVLSIGAGVSSLAISGWRNSSRKSAIIEQQLSELEQHLQQKEELLKEFKLSENRLQISGLNNFLDEQVLSQTNKAYPNLKPPHSSQTEQLKTPPAYQTTETVSAPSTTQQKRQDLTPANAASAFASVQTFLGYSHTQSNTNIKEEIADIYKANQTTITHTEFEQLQRQLKDMMLQMQAMQNNLPSISQSANTVQTENSVSIYYDIQKPQQVEFT